MSTKTIAIDFDGVLVEYHGWKGEMDYGAPLPGAIRFLTELISAGYEVVIHTTRAQYPGSVDRIGGWLRSHGLAGAMIDQIRITNLKPAAFLYIDDRSFLFTGTYPTIGEIETFRPWWKK